MTAKRITPPAVLAVSLDAARAAARVDVGPDGKSELDDQISQAVRTFAGEAEHITGRAFITQTWRVTLDTFSQAVRLPGAPLASVDHIKFYDVAGVQQTLDPRDYVIDTESEPGVVVPAPGKAWPATYARINAVEVQYVCGFGDDDTAVPDEIKGYILACVQLQFAPVQSAKQSNFEGLLDRWKVYA